MSNPSRTPIRLLIVDDDEQMRRTLVGRFERKGLAVSNAGSGEQALEIAAKRALTWPSSTCTCRASTASSCWRS